MRKQAYRTKNNTIFAAHILTRKTTDMVSYQIGKPQKLGTTIKLPASKSISNRALIIRALSACDIQLENISDCDDTNVIQRALRDMPEVIDIKAAGTAMRFMTAFLSTTDSGTHTLTGTERMQNRPIKPLVDALRQLGADIEYEGKEGFPPLRITGKQLEGGQIEVAGNVSSQYISALILTAPTLKKGMELRLLGDITSRPYIDLTLWMMHEFGADAEWSGVDTITVSPTPYSKTTSYYIESDWSAASYWYEMIALSDQPDAEVKLEGLMDGSKQGDSSVRYIFSLLGIRTIFKSRTPGKPTTVTLRKNGHRVRKLEYDFTGQPDLTQTFVVCCCMMDIPFRFTGLHTLRIKETDRIEALKTEMRKLGFVLHYVDGNTLEWSGERCEPQPQPTIDTYDDHRMALAFAPVAMKQDIRINNPQVVSKSYPHFWDHIRQAGFNITNP